MNLFIYPQFSNSGMSEISRGYAKLFGIPTNTDDFREYELTLFKMFVEEHYLPSIENILKSYLSGFTHMEPLKDIDKLFELSDIKPIRENGPNVLANKYIYVTYAPEFLKCVNLVNHTDNNESKNAFRRKLELDISFYTKTLSYAKTLSTEAALKDDAYISILGMFKAICLPIDMPLTMAMSATQTALKNLSPDEAAEEFWLRPIETANLTEFKKQYEAVVKFIK